MKRLVSCAAAAGCLIGLSAFAGVDNGAVSVTTDIRPAAVTVGDELTYTIRVDGPRDTQIRVPAVPERWGNFTVRSFDPRENRRGDRSVMTARYRLVSFETGNMTIPAVSIEYKPAGYQRWSTTDVPAASVEVASMLGDDPAFDEAIEGPIVSYAPVFWVLAAASVLAAAAAVYVLRRNRRRPGAPVRSLSAHEIAFKELEELQCRMLIAQGHIKEYFVEISGIIRRYIENRFNLHAPEMTTEEFLESIRSSQALKDGHALLLKEFLTCCDLVKFARYRPEQKETDAMYASAHNFITQTKEEPRGQDDPLSSGEVRR